MITSAELPDGSGSEIVSAVRKQRESPAIVVIDRDATRERHESPLVLRTARGRECRVDLERAGEWPLDIDSPVDRRYRLL